jgi:hypothetical protein
VNNFSCADCAAAAVFRAIKLDHTPVWLKRKIDRALDLFFTKACDANVLCLRGAARCCSRALPGRHQYAPSIDASRAGAFGTNSNA